MRDALRSVHLATVFGAVVLGAQFPVRVASDEGDAGAATERTAEEQPPERYVLDYPAAESLCPPVETFFYEVVRTFEVVRGRRFTHQLNGGYGLPVAQQVNGRHLLHLGADVGWHRVGAPVYAVASGIVRASDGPEFGRSSKSGNSREERNAANAARASGAMHWGNVITIEHRLPDGEHFTTIYGHLGTERLVKAGDVVAAGQQIGSVGRKHARVNGGYDPHVHFAIRNGRLAEPGCTLFEVRVDEQPEQIKLVEVTEEEIELDIPAALSLGSIKLGDRVYAATAREGRFFAPARMLWDVKTRPGFEIAGYGLDAEGWYDPVAFLRCYGADRNPAPFRRRLKGR